MVRTFGKSLAVVLALLVIGSVVGVLWPLASAPLPSPTRNYVIVNVRVIDVETGRAGPLESVTVRDGIITAIGNPPAGSGVNPVDGKGGFLLPGFWDMHSHSFQLSPQLHFPLLLANGVTGVRDMMDCPDERDTLIACVADKRRWTIEAAAGRLVSPRFVGLSSFYFESPDLTPVDVSDRARTYADRGLDAFKVYNRLSRPAYFQLAEEAARLDIRLVGHLPKAISLNEAIVAGQSSFEHGHLFVRHCFRRAAAWREGRLDAEPPAALAVAMVAEHDAAACQQSFVAMRARQAWFVPTHVTREEDARAGDPTFIDDPRLDYLDPLSRWAYKDDLAATSARYPGLEGKRALRRYFEHGLKLTGEAHRAGVPILIGTDTAIGGFRFHDEMALLVRAGLRPADVLRAATIEAARHAGVEKQFGSVAIGKRADLVLLAANPLDDIANTRRLQAVFFNGQLYDRQHLDRLLIYTRAQANAPSNWIKLLWGFARSSVSSEL